MKDIVYDVNDPAFQKIYRILQPKERLKFILIMVLSIFTALVETAGVGSFMPFIYLLVDTSVIHSNKYLDAFYRIGKFEKTNDFIVFLGITVAGVIIFSNLLIMLNNYVKNRFVFNNTHRLSTRLLKSFLNKPYEFILLNNSSKLNKTILQESNEFNNKFLLGIIDIGINLFVLLFMVVLLFVVNPVVTTYVLLFFIIIYGSISISSRNYIRKSGLAQIEANKQKFKTVSEALSSFKITKAMGIEDYFVERYKSYSKESVKQLLFEKILAEMPRYVMDALVFCAMIAIVLIMIVQGHPIATFIPTFSVFAYAGYRIMPILSNIFKSLTHVMHTRPVLDLLYEDMFIRYRAEEFAGVQMDANLNYSDIRFENALVFDHVFFNYYQSEPIIKDLNLTVPKNSIVGFAGTTGAGKTTLIDLFLGLLNPQSGMIKVDNTLINPQNVQGWRKMIGYVPQDVFLVDDTIYANIAFGVPAIEIDRKKVHQCARIASIAEFIESELPDSYETIIGERGARLSGGQRQRLGLARALYRNPQILVLDEATSALDGATEESVLKGIHEESQVKTILIIAHRLDTLKVCDTIHILESGQIVGSGTYDSLLQSSPVFRRMAKIENTNF